jgi:outer membrane murein-binding lipoprotein Lpp
MMKKLMVVGAAAAGYVLGAKAGRERYEQIATQAQKLRTNPTVQKKVDEAKHAAKDAASSAVDKAKSHTGSGDSYESSSTGPNGFGRGDEAS